MLLYPTTTHTFILGVFAGDGRRVALRRHRHPPGHLRRARHLPRLRGAGAASGLHRALNGGYSAMLLVFLGQEVGRFAA